MRVNKEFIVYVVKLTVGVILFLGFVVGLFYVCSGLLARYTNIKYIVIKGNNILPANTIKNLVISSGCSVHSYNLSKAYFNLISNPWVETAKIARIFPDTIFVIVREKEPAAIVFWNKEKLLVDANGDAIDTYKPYLHLPTGLLRIVLKSNMLNDKRLLRAVILMNEKLDKIGKISYIDVISDGCQVVHFRSGLNVVVNSLDCPDVAIKRFSYKWRYLNSLKNGLDSVSICFDNKFVLKWKRGVKK